MRVRLGGSIALLACALAFSAPPLAAKGKDNFLSEQAFKRAQGQSLEQNQDSGYGLFPSEQSLSGLPQIITPDMPQRQRFDYSSSDSGGEPLVITPGNRLSQGLDFTDPEPDIPPSKSPDAGFGTYPVPKFVPLADPTLDVPAPTDLLATAIVQQLRTPASAVSTTAEQRDAAIAFYRQNNFAPLWVAPNGVTEKAKRTLALLSHADDDGLNSRDYLPPPLRSFTDVSSVSSEPAALAQVEIALTARVLRFAEDIHSGRIEPKKLSGYYDLVPPKLNLGQVLAELSLNAAPETYLASLAPSHPAYRQMKASLAELRAKQGQNEAVVIPLGKPIKVGERDGRVPALRQRLVALGFLSEENALGWMLGHPIAAEGDASQFEQSLDSKLVRALKDFQSAHDLKANGRLDDDTLAVLNSPDQKNEEKLVLNMERMRWLPNQLGSRYVFVNESAFELRVVENENVVWKTKVVVGKPETQTYVFSDSMETVVVNPYWGVPKSIVAHEMLPHLMDDPSYLDRQGFEVVDASGQIVPSSSVDWWSYGSNIPFDVRQLPGDDNALGKIKFLFPNSHDIYMHDTPSKKLFKQSVRAFSHGCIRVEDPRRLAEIVLGMDGAQIDDLIASGKTQELSLNTPIPVHLAYFTAWPDENGEMVYYSDIYKRDTRLEKALGKVEAASN